MSLPDPRIRLACRFVQLAIALVVIPSSLFANEPFHAVAVAENVVTLSSVPDFRLDVADEFSYLGSTSFLLGDRAEADVFLFAEKDGISVERFVKVQVESLIDDAAKDYHWEGTDTFQVGEAEYDVGFWCFDAAEVALEKPESDTANTQKWLAENGHRQTGVFVGTRLARVFNGGRSELLLFYGETARLTGVDCNDEETAMAHLPAIVERSDAAFTLTDLEGQ